MKEATCVYLVRPGEILMADQQSKIIGTKGYGGKIKSGQSVIQNIIEETLEETGGEPSLRINKNEEGGIKILMNGLSQAGILDFYNGTEDEVPFGNPNFRVHFYTCSTFSGNPIDTIEMRNHKWYPVGSLPYDKMIKGDELFMPLLLKGQMFSGWIRHSADLSKIIYYEID